MLQNTFRRPTVLSFLICVLCMAAVRPSEGQENGSWIEPDLGAPGGIQLAQQPDAAVPEAPVAPPAPAVVGEPLVERPGEELPLLPGGRPDPTAMLAYQSPMTGLASVPNMFGDSFFGGGQITVCSMYCPGDDVPVGMSISESYCSTADIPPIGVRRLKISENNKALPMDRVFFTYNHFQNALDETPGFGDARSFPYDQYTVGVEKTFNNGLCSLELRMPFAAAHDFSAFDPLVDSGDVGNLAVTLKRVLRATNRGLLAVGFAVETPTGSYIHGTAGGSDFTLHNNALYLAPWIGFLTMPNSRLFYEGFLELNIAANGNQVDYAGSNIGTLSEQNLMFVDLSVGYWLLRNPRSRRCAGLAGIVEYHYTTTLQDADTLDIDAGPSNIRFGNTRNRVDVSNLTAGLYTEVGKTTLSVGGVFPLQTDSNRLFDAEVQVYVNRLY